MRSRLAEDLKREQRARAAAMTPEERAALALQLGQQWLDDYMCAHGVDRATALAVARRSRRAGRKPSKSMDGRDAF